MKPPVKKDFDWQMQHVPKAQAILDMLPAKLFTTAKVAPREIDIHKNGDLVMLPFGGKLVAMRLRRPGYIQSYGLQITFRSSRDTGAETELPKIRRGLGDWFFYGHIERINEQEQLRRWIIIDLHAFREWLTDERINAAKLIDNRDGTYGRAFNILEISSMIIAASDAMNAAIKSAIGTPRQTTMPPQLADLISKYGGYDLIPQEAWEDHDKKSAAWYLAHRENRTVIT
jgi:hypothetical protein